MPDLVLERCWRRKPRYADRTGYIRRSFGIPRKKVHADTKLIHRTGRQDIKELQDARCRADHLGVCLAQGPRHVETVGVPGESEIRTQRVGEPVIYLDRPHVLLLI